MVEEATGTRLYESKKEAAQKVIERKDAKLQEMDSVSFLCITVLVYFKYLYLLQVKVIAHYLMTSTSSSDVDAMTDLYISSCVGKSLF